MNRYMSHNGFRFVVLLTLVCALTAVFLKYSGTASSQRAVKPLPVQTQKTAPEQIARSRPVPSTVLAPLADGALDTTFHDPGSTKSPAGVDRLNLGATAADSDGAAGIGIQTLATNAGKIVLGGDNQPTGAIRNLAVARYNSAGTLDAGFGASGKTVTSVSPRGTTTTNSGSQMLAIDPTDDGIILISEITDPVIPVVVCNPSGFTSGSEWLITRYTANGTLDAAFNASGTGYGAGGTGVAGNRILNLSSGCRNFPTGVVVRADGEIVVVGFTQNSVTGNFGNAIALLTKAGALDSTNFPSGGIVTNAFAGEIWAVTLDGSGKYVVAGDNPPGGSSDFLVARFNTNGTLDSTNFNSGGGTPGVNTTSIGAQDTARAVTVQPDGKIIVAGDTGNSLYGMVRYNSNGTLDNAAGTGFGATHNGITTTAIGSGTRQVNSVNVMSDNRIVLTGKTTATSPGNQTVNGVGIARYSSGGVLDNGFGASGVVVTQMGTDPTNSQDLGATANTGTLQSDGKILVAGQLADVGAFANTDLDFFVARFQNTPVVLAAGVSVSGRVTTAEGQGLRNAAVVLTDSHGVSRTVLTGAFGNYQFDDVQTGDTYIIGVASKHYRFGSRVLVVTDTASGQDFVADE